MLGDLTEQEVVEILENNIVGRIGCYDGTTPYIVPVSYLVQEGHVLCHSRMGLKIEMMRRNPNVCFEVDEIRDYNNWRCVIAWGEYNELVDEKEVEAAKAYFSEYMLTSKTSKTAEPPEGQTNRQHPDQKTGDETPIFYKIEFTKITGRFEKQV